MRWPWRPSPAVFDTALRPSLEVICTTTEEGAADKARQFGFARATSDWRSLVADPRVEAVVIASPQHTHREIALAAFAPASMCSAKSRWALGADRAAEMLAAAEASGLHST